MNRSVLLLLLLLIAAGCNKRSQTTKRQASSPIQQKAIQEKGTPRIAACALISAEEVGAIQGATILDAKSSAGWNGNLVVSQCYYSSKEPNMSVSLTLSETDPPRSSDADLRNYWNESFNPKTAGENQAEANDRKAGDDAEESEGRIPPRKVSGVGEEAYWMANRFGGTLYVLKTDLIIRVSVGGPGTNDAKLDKCKALAEKIVGQIKVKRRGISKPPSRY